MRREVVTCPEHEACQQVQMSTDNTAGEEMDGIRVFPNRPVVVHAKSDPQPRSPVAPENLRRIRQRERELDSSTAAVEGQREALSRRADVLAEQEKLLDASREAVHAAAESLVRWEAELAEQQALLKLPRPRRFLKRLQRRGWFA